MGNNKYTIKLLNIDFNKKEVIGVGEYGDVFEILFDSIKEENFLLDNKVRNRKLGHYTGPITFMDGVLRISADLKEVEYEEIDNTYYENLDDQKKELEEQVADSEKSELPSKLSVAADGKLVKEFIKAEEEMQKVEEELKERTLKEEIPILKEVGAMEDADYFAAGVTTVKQTKDSTLKSLYYDREKAPWFIGMFITGENTFVPLGTPHEEFSKQYMIVFKNKKVAQFVFRALQLHPATKDSVEACSIYPLSVLADAEDNTKMVLISDGLQFINMLPRGRTPAA